MYEQAKKVHGAFSWSELMTSDLNGAKGFYGELLGWEFEDVDTSCGGYTYIRSGKELLGGMMVTPENEKDMPPAWGVYITVDDVDARVAKVAALGGAVCIEPTDLPDIGRFAVVKDPQGAYSCLITYV